MGRKRKGPSVSGYFRQLFTDRPELLEEKSNAAILAKYREDNGLAPDAELTASVRNNLANIKSLMRRKDRKATGKSKVKVSVAKGGVRLEALEELIDECLTQARSLDRDNLGSVIAHLRKARNEVVWKMGQ